MKSVGESPWPIVRALIPKSLFQKALRGLLPFIGYLAEFGECLRMGKIWKVGCYDVIWINLAGIGRNLC